MTEPPPPMYTSSVLDRGQGERAAQGTTSGTCHLTCCPQPDRSCDAGCRGYTHSHSQLTSEPIREGHTIEPGLHAQPDG